MTETPDDQPTEHLPPQQPAAAPFAPDPFAPRPRAPREPWVHPGRRNRFTALAVGAALVLFGAGFGAGWAASGGGGHEGPGWMRDMRHPGYLQPYEGGGPQYAPPNRPRRPRKPHQRRPPATATPTATPTPTKTS